MEVLFYEDIHFGYLAANAASGQKILTVTGGDIARATVGEKIYLNQDRGGPPGYSLADSNKKKEIGVIAALEQSGNFYQITLEENLTNSYSRAQKRSGATILGGTFVAAAPIIGADETIEVPLDREYKNLAFYTRGAALLADTSISVQADETIDDLDLQGGMLGGTHNDTETLLVLGEEDASFGRLFEFLSSTGVDEVFRNEPIVDDKWLVGYADNVYQILWDRETNMLSFRLVPGESATGNFPTLCYLTVLGC